jgi:hypothetical protein
MTLLYKYLKITSIQFTIALALLLPFSINGQCHLDRHNTTWYDGWVSCEKSTSPNPTRGSGHWLMYSLGHRYVLGSSHLWNHNVPATLDQGAKEIAIDYSLDGVTWTTLGNHSLSKGTGENIYEGEAGPNMMNVEARYVLITVLETYGGNCAGISEVKIDVKLSTAADDKASYLQCMTADIYPNPVTSVVNVKVNSACADRSILYLTDVNGNRVSADYDAVDESKIISIPAVDLTPGVYFAHIISGDKKIQKRIIKVD